MASKQNTELHCFNHYRIRSFLVVSFFMAACCLALPAHAQEDVAGAKDHPLFPRMPGYYIARYEERPSASYMFITDTEQSSRVQGFYLRIDYAVRQGASKPDPVELGQKYSNILVRNGGSQIYQSRNAVEPRWVTRMPTGAGRQVWMEILVRDEGASYALTLVDGVVVEQKLNVSSVEALSRELRARGSARLSRIQFEPGKGRLRTDSEAPLVIVSELMKNEPALKLEVHVEPMSSPARNGFKLARKRQNAIVYFITSQGVPFSRIRSGKASESPPTPAGSIISPDNPGAIFVKF